MIIYESDNLYKVIFRLKGSVYIPTFQNSLLSMLIAGGLCIVREYDKSPFSNFENAWSYSVFTFVLGFVLVFRCQMAYKRFWDGREAIEAMTSEWVDAAIKCVSFDKRAKLPEENIRLWRSKMVSLFSLLHGVALSALSDEDIEMDIITGIDESVTTQINLGKVQDDVYLTYSWIQDELMSRMAEGGLNAPPPIATRIWQSLGNGMNGYNNACMIDDTPFPFPYAQIIALLLVILGVSCGYVMAVFVEHPFWVVFLTGVAVSGYHALNEVAKELENPFGNDDNDLPLENYQAVMNNRLQQLLYLGDSYFAIPQPSAASERRSLAYAKPKPPPQPAPIVVPSPPAAKPSNNTFRMCINASTEQVVVPPMVVPPRVDELPVAIPKPVWDGPLRPGRKFKPRWLPQAQID